MSKTTKYKKITVGFVIQEFTQQGNKFVCIEQTFVAGDQVDREDDNGDPVEINFEQEVYQAFDMKQPEPNSEFEQWYKEYKHNDGVQRHFRSVVELNPDYPLCFKDWAKKYYKECVDI